MPSDEQSKLRLAPRESIDEMVRRIEREQRTVHREAEAQLSGGLAPFRAGSVPYLNAVPLTRGIEDEILFLPPAQLAEQLRQGAIDAALLSVTEALLNDRYDVLDGVAVASLGEVKSVFLAHRSPIREATEVFYDPASLTSVCLLRVLLAEQGLFPQLKPLDTLNPDPFPDYALLIGNPAIDFLRSGPDHALWDLGAAWFELTRLPFVYAVWALRRGIENEPLRRQLRSTRDFGLETLDQIIRERSEYDLEFRKDYLGWHIHYHLGSDEKRGLERFGELLEKHGLGPVHPLSYV